MGIMKVKKYLTKADIVFDGLFWVSIFILYININLANFFALLYIGIFTGIYYVVAFFLGLGWLMRADPEMRKALIKINNIDKQEANAVVWYRTISTIAEGVALYHFGLEVTGIIYLICCGIIQFVSDSTQSESPEKS